MSPVREWTRMRIDVPGFSSSIPLIDPEVNCVESVMLNFCKLPSLLRASKMLRAGSTLLTTTVVVIVALGLCCAATSEYPPNAPATMQTTK